MALHRLRQGYLRTRTARINAVRGHLREFGCVIPLGAQQVVPRVSAALADDSVPVLLRPALATVLEENAALAEKGEAIRTELARLSAQMPDAQCLLTVRQPDDLRVWARAVGERKGHNVAAVALANKLARVCWRVWRDQRPFERRDPP